MICESVAVATGISCKCPTLLAKNTTGCPQTGVVHDSFSFVRKVSLLLSRGTDVILYTSRGVPLQGDGAGGLVFGERVGAALVACVSGLTERPRFLLSKGGITSSDVATQALAMKRAEVSVVLGFCGAVSGRREGGHCRQINRVALNLWCRRDSTTNEQG